jgi:hypothetical protein
LSALFILAAVDFQGILPLNPLGNTQFLIKFFYHPYYWLYMRALEGNTSPMVLLATGLTDSLITFCSHAARSQFTKKLRNVSYVKTLPGKIVSPRQTQPLSVGHKK